MLPSEAMEDLDGDGVMDLPGLIIAIMRLKPLCFQPG